jgi:restriction system protein
MPDENTPLLPKYDDLFEPTLEALTKLGGSGSIGELDEAVTAAIGASQEQLDVTYPKSGAAVLPDRMKWARSHLKIAGLVANPKQGVWVLTDEGRIAATKSPAELKQSVIAAYKSSIAAKKAAEAADKDEDVQSVGDGAVGWSDLLLQRVQASNPPRLSAYLSAYCARAASLALRLLAGPGMTVSTAWVCCASI